MAIFASVFVAAALAVTGQGNSSATLETPNLYLIPAQTHNFEYGSGTFGRGALPPGTDESTPSARGRTTPQNPSSPSGTTSVPGGGQVDLSDPNALGRVDDNQQNSFPMIVVTRPGDPLNVREQPGPRSYKIMALPNGTPVQAGRSVTLNNGNTWKHICAHGQCGWSNSRYLAPQAGTGGGGGQILRVVNVAGNDVLNMRAQPSARSARVGSIPPYANNVQYLSRRARNGGSVWAYVQYGSVRGWVNTRFLAQ